MGRDLGPGRAAVLERDRFEDPVDDPDRAGVEAGQDLSQCFGVVLAILEQALDLLSDVARGLPVFGEVSDRIPGFVRHAQDRSEEHTSELQSLMRISYAVLCLQKKKEMREANAR